MNECEFSSNTLFITAKQSLHTFSKSRFRTPKEPLFDESKCVKYFNSTESCEYKVKSKSKKEDEEEDSNCVITGYKPQE